MKVIAIHQPNFMPWLGYFYKILHSDVFVFLDTVYFQQGNHDSITNRTKIKCNGEEKFFTICVKKNNDSKLIKDIAIDKFATNIKKQLKTIKYNYAKSEYFTTIFPVLEKMLFDCMEYNFMAEANMYVIKTISSILDIETPFVVASDLNVISHEKNERIIEICKLLTANTYFSGNGGKKYHNEILFQDKGVNIKYTEFKAREYKQIGTNFIPGLSVIDVLMNCGVEQTKNFIK